MLCGLVIHGYAITPSYYGARSLSLGYASTAFNYDINSIFYNPALLSSINYTLWGYQYQHSYMDYKNFSEDLSQVLEFDLKEFESLDIEDRTTLFSQLENIFQASSGMWGNRSNIPGYASRNYGLSFAMIKTAIVDPVQPGEDFFAYDVADITNADIASLQMNFTGLKYKQISLALSMEVYRSVSLGITVHYLNGKITEFTESITEDIFTASSEPKDYLEHGWESTDEKFSKIVLDAGVLVNLGQFFNIGLVYKNIGAAKISSPHRKIALSKRITAGFAFKPNSQWGIYVDMDIKKTKLLYNNREMQPISIGIEKGFFENKFFIRAGMLNDLTEKKLLGKNSIALYCLGVGFNMGKIVIDAGLGLNSNGTVKNLAVSGFILMN